MSSPKQPRIIVMGNKNLAVGCLKYLLDRKENVLGAICNSDDTGKENEWFQSLKLFAQKNNIRTWQPRDCNDEVFINEIIKQRPDYIFSFSYNRIIKKKFIDLAKEGIYNIHFAQLPKNRGCFPVIYSLASSDEYGAVTLHEIDSGIDTGPIISQRLVKISQSDTAYSLYFKCVKAGVALFKRTWPILKNHKIKAKPQNLGKGSYHTLKYPNDRWIKWSDKGVQIDRLIRALTFLNYPSGRSIISGKEVEILHPVTILEEKYHARPGAILKIDRRSLIVMTGDKAIALKNFRYKSKLMPPEEFARKFKLKAGDIFQNPKDRHLGAIKILHVGNIANNAYLNAKFLRNVGIHSDVLCYDYYHVMGSPEWEEVEINDDCGDDFNPDWSKIELRGYKRPRWFYQGPTEGFLAHLNQERLKNYSGPLKDQREKITHHSLPDKIINLIYNFCFGPETGEGFFGFIKKPVRMFTNLLQPWLAWTKEQLLPPEERFRRVRLMQKLVEDFRVSFPHRKDRLTYKDIRPYFYQTGLLKPIFAKYDIVQCYATDPIYPMLAEKYPYIAFEHGTIRAIPFEKSSLGRLTALAYRKANLVFITNSDNIKAAEKLGLQNHTSIPHPIPAFWHQKLKDKVDREKEKVILFCPTRHDWAIKGVDQYLRALGQILKSNQKFKLILVEWGMDLEKSKRLIKEAQLEKHIEWHKPMPRQQLIYWMLKADIVLDQLIIPAMGGIAAEALQAGKPVLASYSHDLCKWMFPEKPPLIIIKKENEIVPAIMRLIDNASLRKKIGSASKTWFAKYLSEKVVLKKLADGYRKVIQ